jgi:hypothetical protein
MSIDYIEAVISPPIPTECLTALEIWFLTRVFKTEEIKTDERGNRLGLHACWSLNDVYEKELLPDYELSRAFEASHEICPDLHASVEHEINKSGAIILGAVGYEKIFQSVMQRSPGYLQHISVNERICNTRSIDYDETFTLITADAIESICLKSSYDSGGRKRVEIVRRSGPPKPESPYILF